VLQIRSLSVRIGGTLVLDGVDLAVRARELTAIVGPSGAGKSSLLRAINLLDVHEPGYVRTGRILFGDQDITAPGVDANRVRQSIGMVFQKPVVFPTSVAGNVLFGVRHLALEPRAAWPAILEAALRRSALWDEVKDRLDAAARALSQGQQQRLCLARALAVKPDVLLLDEPTASLDPRSTELVEESVVALTRTTTVVLVTHNLGQARRVAAGAAVMVDGRVVEAGCAADVLSAPRSTGARAYLTRESAAEESE
jgi:phosphate transport system ATP-binding protein